MDSNASGIKRTVIIVRIVAELLSEFVEGFFGRLSYKTCVSVISIKIVFIYQLLLQIFFSIIFVFRNVGKSLTS
jgi:hypothetical protein